MLLSRDLALSTLTQPCTTEPSEHSVWSEVAGGRHAISLRLSRFEAASFSQRREANLAISLTRIEDRVPVSHLGGEFACLRLVS